MSFDLSLGPTNPPPIYVAEETLGFRRSEISSEFSLLIPAFSLPQTPAKLTSDLHCQRDAPLPLARRARPLITLTEGSPRSPTLITLRQSKTTIPTLSAWRRRRLYPRYLWPCPTDKAAVSVSSLSPGKFSAQGHISRQVGID